MRSADRPLWKLLLEFLRDRGKFPRFVIEKSYAGLCMDHFSAAFPLPNKIINITPKIREILYGDLDAERFPVKSFRFVNDRGVRHDDAHTFDVHFRPSVFDEHSQPGFVDDGKDGIIAEMSAVIDVGDPDGDLCGEVVRCGKIDLESGHEKKKAGRCAGVLLCCLMEFLDRTDIELSLLDPLDPFHGGCCSRQRGDERDLLLYRRPADGVFIIP
jgi:hypothetical protein